MHVVTGGTGFVGAALVLELLRETSCEIGVIVRPGKDGSPKERFRSALAAAVAAYEEDPRLLAAAEARCRVVGGDVTRPLCDVAELDLPIDQFWHCAASLNYENRHREEIERTNIVGTQNALALAERLGTTTFNYVSTAYVAGKRGGLIREEVSSEVATNNIYERSKIAAEELVAATTTMRTRILRPSIVIGHSRTRAATAFTGFYGFLRGVVQFKGMVARAHAGLLEKTPLRLRMDADLGINLIPIDRVVREAVRIACSDAYGVFHLTHPTPPRTGDLIGTVFREIGLPEPVLVGNSESMGWLDEQLNRRLDFYNSYVVGTKHFDRARCDAVVGSGDTEVMDDSAIATYARWYLEKIVRQRAALPVAR
jgi:nucleoside-diphosphate-sugar epimerase